MAELQLSRADVHGARFPPICMQCGEPAAREVLKKYTTDQVAVLPPPDEPVGCLIVWPILGLLKLFSWSTAVTMTVRTPLCEKHARWFSWSTLTAKMITEDFLVLAGVSDRFLEAWEAHRAAAGRDRELVKVRCRSCRALNDEKAKFCDQCGAVI